MNEMHHDFKPIISDKAKITGKGHIKIGAFTVIEDYVLLDTANNLNSYIPKFQSINNHRLSINKLCHYFQ